MFQKAGCGTTLAAATTWKARTLTLGNNATHLRAFHTICNDWITAPAGKKIQIKVTAVKDVICSYGCPYKRNRTEDHDR
ncbi:hypothetical protein OSTOST_03927 [Ostertagia ostertagi]